MSLTKSESEVTHSCPTLCDPMDCSLPGSFVRGIFQARVLEWVAITFSEVGLRKHHMNKTSGGGGIPVELFQILKDDAVEVLHSICQQIWKTQQWPPDWKRSVFHSNPKERQCQGMFTLLHNCTHLTSSLSNAQNSASKASTVREP